MLVLNGATDGEEAFFHPGHENDRKLETLGRVEGDEGEAAAGIGLQRVNVRDEGHALKVLRQRLARRGGAEFFQLGAELEDVGPAVEIFFDGAVEGGAVAGAVEDGIE